MDCGSLSQRRRGFGRSSNKWYYWKAVVYNLDDRALCGGGTFVTAVTTHAGLFEPRDEDALPPSLSWNFYRSQSPFILPVDPRAR